MNSRRYSGCSVFVLAGSLAFCLSAQEPTGENRARPAQLSHPTNTPGVAMLELTSWPPNPTLSLPTPTSNWVAAYFLIERQRVPRAWVYNEDATQAHLELSALVRPLRKPAHVYLEHAERTTQFPDGRIVFSALDAEVQGSKAKLESHPGNHRIGFWTSSADSVRWNYKPTRWGSYDIELAYSADGAENLELEIEAAGKTFHPMRPSTGSWYRYRTLSVGRVYVAKAEPFQVVVSCPKLRDGAALNLKAVIFRPAPEGQPILQESSGTVTLAARDAITHSTMMRYEPATNKNCLGFWVNPGDWAEWEFTVSTPGTFEVEVWQGCGKGNGGSEAAVELADTRLTWTVEDTGHFQNFVPRRLGRVRLTASGTHGLAVRALRKQAAAVMDIRQIRLLPVEAK